MVTRKLPLVAVVGRPNVGKSTLFNRIVPRGDAVVDDMPGVTRDRREDVASWNGRDFRFVDTGGLVPGSRDAIESAILSQANRAVEEADLVLFVVDAREGITALDREIAQSLRVRSDRVLLVANKVEGNDQELAATEAASLGFGEPRTISGQHGRGVGDLLDEVVARLPEAVLRESEEETVQVALLGCPNVGKSSIANRLLGEERFIVHSEAGTTRDAVDAEFRYDGTRFLLVDTAGLRRRSHVETGVEFYSTLRTRRSLAKADVAVLVLDASRKISAQDARIAGMIAEAGKPMVFALNKWDLVEKVTGTAEAFTRLVRDKFPRLAGSPVVLISALTGQRVARLPETLRELARQQKVRVPTARLNEVLQDATSQVHPPLRAGSKPVKLFYVTQTGSAPPVFTVFANDPKAINASYRQYLHNFFRDALGLESVPLRVTFRARRKAG